MLPPGFAAKLGIKKGMRVMLQGESKEFRAALVSKLPEGALLTHAPPADVLIHWLQPLETIELLMPRLREQIDDEGAVWIVLPTAAERERRGMQLSEMEIVSAAAPADLVENKTLPFNEKEEGLRFVVPKEKRKPARKR